MIKLKYLTLFMTLVGCAQFGGLESESQQGLIPELFILGSSDEPMSDVELIQEQAQYYTSSARAMYFQAMVDRLDRKIAKEKYQEKALKAQEMAISAESNVSTQAQ